MKPVIIFIFIQGALVKDVLLMSTKTWLRNINFNNSLNWDLGRLPCSQDNVIFPKSMGFVVQVPDGETTLRQLVLPLDGELLLPLNGELRMSKPNDKNDKCQGNDIKFLQWKSSWWIDPNSWSGHNSATPDLEAIPCPTDSITFQPKASFSVVMPDNPVRVAALSISGKSLETNDWREMMLTDEGQAQFFTENRQNVPEIRVTGQSCTDITGCECNNEELRDYVCNKVCGNTPCLDPVKPYGNCCPICGAYLLFKYHEEYTKSKLEKYLEAKLSNENVDFHVSKVQSKIQIVLLEKEEYQEKAQYLADSIREDVKKGSDLGLELIAEFSAGAVVYPPSPKRQAFIFLVCLFVSICTLAVLFYSYTDACKRNLRDENQYLYAVFDNQPEIVEICGTNGSTRRASRRQAFDNPMYGSTDEVESKDQDTISEECPIYDMLEEINLEKEGFEDEVLPKSSKEH